MYIRGWGTWLPSAFVIRGLLQHRVQVSVSPPIIMTEAINDFPQWLSVCLIPPSVIHVRFIQVHRTYLRHFPSVRPSARRVLSLKSHDGFLWNLARVIDDWKLFDNLILVRIDCICLWPIRYTWSCQTEIEFTVPEIACTKKKNSYGLRGMKSNTLQNGYSKRFVNMTNIAGGRYI